MGQDSDRYEWGRLTIMCIIFFWTRRENIDGNFWEFGARNCGVVISPTTGLISNLEELYYWVELPKWTSLVTDQAIRLEPTNGYGTQGIFHGALERNTAIHTTATTVLLKCFKYGLRLNRLYWGPNPCHLNETQQIPGTTVGRNFSSSFVWRSYLHFISSSLSCAALDISFSCDVNAHVVPCRIWDRWGIYKQPIRSDGFPFKRSHRLQAKLVN